MVVSKQEQFTILIDLLNLPKTKQAAPTRNSLLCFIINPYQNYQIVESKPTSRDGNSPLRASLVRGEGDRGMLCFTNIDDGLLLNKI